MTDEQIEWLVRKSAKAAGVFLWLHERLVLEGEVHRVRAALRRVAESSVFARVATAVREIEAASDRATS